MNASGSQAGVVTLSGLDELWFQVAGTRCNLECAHCFISCSPHNDSFGFLSLEAVRLALEESVCHGVREYYFTGGEPFLNPELVDMLCLALEYGPVTVLTNATVLKPTWLDRLQRAESEGVYSLEFRVSIDGPDAATNDPIRGEGTFDRAMRGVALLVRHGMLPIITMTRTWADADDPGVLTAFRRVLAEHGCERPRLKILPRLLIGAEATRTCGYTESDHVSARMLDGYDQTQLVCSHSRTISDRGVHVCPILLDEPGSLVGDSLSQAPLEFQLDFGACATCYQYGAICTNPSTSAYESVGEGGA